MIRTAVPEDMRAIAALNKSAVPAVSDVERAELERLARAGICLVVGDSVVGGFVIALTEGADYQSPNYRYFAGRHDEFAYIDRIVIADELHGRGLGRMLYDAVTARVTAPVLCAEVNIRPRNEQSLRFHLANGFEEVGEQDTDGGAKRVVLLERALA